jgi:UTP--glucose-1-phosphate uridylyltransferase
MAVDKLSKYGIISFKDEKKRLLGNIVEKPKPGKAPSRLASYGRYLLTSEVFEYLTLNNTGLDGELWTVDAITRMAVGGKVLVEKSKGRWMTTGDPENYFLAHLKYVLQYEKYAEVVTEYVKNELNVGK